MADMVLVQLVGFALQVCILSCALTHLAAFILKK